MNKHRWTDDELELVRRDYKGTNKSAGEIGLSLGVTQWAVKGQVQRMGIAQQKSPPWAEDEIERLRALIHQFSVTTIAKKLHRSPNAVKVKATRLKLGLRARDDWYTKRDVCEILGVDHKKAQAWIDNGFLTASWHSGGMSIWHIKGEDLKRFIIHHSGELLGRNVDIQQIVWIITDESNLRSRRR